MTRRLTVAAAIMFMWMGTAFADQLLFAPVNDSGWNPNFSDTNASGWNLSVPDQDVVPGLSPTTDSSFNQSFSAPVVPPPPVVPMISAPQVSLTLPVDDHAGDSSPVIAPTGGGDWTLSLSPQASGALAFLFFGNPPAVTNPVVGDFTPAEQPVLPFAPVPNGPVATPEPGTLGLLIAGAAFVALRSLQSKRS